MIDEAEARRACVAGPVSPMRATHIAWLGHANFGDDVMALAVRRFLDSGSGQVEYRIWCEGRPRTGPGVLPVYPMGMRLPVVRKLLERAALRETDLLMIGGGSVLHSENSIAWKLAAVRKLRRLNPAARAVGIGLSVGPFPGPRARALCEELLQALDGAAFRELASQEFAESLDLPYRPVRTFDLAASYLEQAGFERRPTPAAIRRVGVSLKAPSRGRDGAVKRWKTILGRLTDRYEAVDVFAFCSSKKFGDVEFIREIVGTTRTPNLHVVTYDGDVDSFIGRIRVCDFFVSTRLHGLILAFLLNIPASVVSYHRKCDDLATTIGLEPRYVFEEGTLDIDALLGAIEPYSHSPQERFFELATANFAVLS